MIEVSVHSVVDFITNSSSETYTFPADGAVDAAKTILADLMSALGVTGSVDDLFTVELVPSDDSYNHIWSGDIEEWPECVDKGWEEVDKILEEAKEKNDPRLADCVDKHRMTLRIVPKSDTSMDLGQRIADLFTTQEVYD
jgi:hypothetical protein